MKPAKNLAIAAALLAGLAAPLVTDAQTRQAAAANVTLWRLDCGQVFVPDLDFLSDTFIFSGRSKTPVVSCYLIRHGDRYMLWDTGLPLSRLGEGAMSVGGGRAQLARSITDQLADLHLTPDAIGIVALSHYHADHAGQAASFPQAVLMIGAPDLEVVRGTVPAFNLDRVQFAPWTEAGGRIDPVTGDRDVFGDGSVMMLAAPGHTPGHHVLLVRLKSGSGSCPATSGTSTIKSLSTACPRSTPAALTPWPRGIASTGSRRRCTHD